MIKLKDLIKEIGDASAKPYDLRYTDLKMFLSMTKDIADHTFSKPTSTRIEECPEHIVSFTCTETGMDYEITIDSYVGKTTNLSFLKGKAKPKKKYFLESSVSFDVDDEESGIMPDTNLNEQYRVLATVVACIKDFINQVEASELFQLNEITIFPKADKSTASSVDSKRGRFYKAYLEKQINTLPIKAKLDVVSDMGEEKGFKISLVH